VYVLMNWKKHHPKRGYLRSVLVGQMVQGLDGAATRKTVR
jgi:hypothetical protein